MYLIKYKIATCAASAAILSNKDCATDSSVHVCPYFCLRNR